MTVSPEPKLRSLEYLKSGTQTQQKCYSLLTESGVFDMLHDFKPVLVGTFPLGIDVAGSDLDILCQLEEAEKFIEVLESGFRHYPGYRISAKKLSGQESVILRFELSGTPVEIVGQKLPVEQQAAYRHMMIEYRLLQKHGEDFKQEIIRLKKEGMKTEPAFAKVLGLKGDSYQALLALDV